MVGLQREPRRWSQNSDRVLWKQKGRNSKLSLQGLRIILREYGLLTESQDSERYRRIPAEQQPEGLRRPGSAPRLSLLLPPISDLVRRQLSLRMCLCSDHNGPCVRCTSCPVLKIRIRVPFWNLQNLALAIINQNCSQMQKEDTNLFLTAFHLTYYDLQILFRKFEPQYLAE